MRSFHVCTNAALFSLFMLQTGSAVGGGEIYRCADPSGSVVFSDTPCGQDATSFDRPHVPKVGTRLVDPAAVFPSKPAPAKARRATSGSTKRASKQQAYTCRKKERRLDDVNAKLRRGYKRAQGERLRRQRVELEDYIDTYCG